MKVTDDELLLAIFERHLERMPSQIVNHFVGRQYGLRDLQIETQGVGSLFYITATERNQINVKLSHSHKLSRIKDLVAKGKLKARLLADDSLNFFYLDTPAMINAIGATYEFWLKKGVPSGWCSESQSMRCIALDNFDALCQECTESLKAEFLSRRKRHAA